MEALILVAFALGAIVLLEAGYCIVVSLMRWAPVIAIGVVFAWLAVRHAVEPVDALGVAIAACLVARHMLRRR